MHDTVGALPGPQSSCLAITVIIIIIIAVIIRSQFDSSALNMTQAANAKAKATKKCSTPRCRNDAASPRAKFCTGCFKTNASGTGRLHSQWLWN